LVKAFNHLVAATLAADPDVNGGRRVVFVSSDDGKAMATVSALAEQLGSALVRLGRLTEGGTLVQARGSTSAPLKTANPNYTQRRGPSLVKEVRMSRA